MAKPSITNPHDKFFRAAMEHKHVAIDFFNHNLPEKIRNALNVESLQLTQQSYINDELQESLSDLVFSCELADKQAYLTLLIEHQSSPDHMMPFRVHHYIFGMLHSYRKQNPGSLLPAVYTLVFYHGVTSPYPYSLVLWDCFDDPMALMPQVLYQAVPLVDVNQLSDEALKQQGWVGPMARALKHIRKQDMTSEALDILSSLSSLMDENGAIELLQLLVNYILSAGNIEDVNDFIKTGDNRLSGLVRSELMTFAEKLEEQGIQKGVQIGLHEGRQECQQEIALTMLKEGSDTAFVVKITGLALTVVEGLRLSLENKV